MDSVEMLLSRQSSPFLVAPAPNEIALDKILTAGMRVPDHGGLQPWQFTIVKEQGLEKLSDIFVAAATENGADEQVLAKTQKMPFRAPMIIVVSTQYQAHKVPESEQLIAAGCCVHAMQMAAFALGYGAMWRTGDLSYHALVKDKLSIATHDDIVGFLYLGTPGREVTIRKSKPYQAHVRYL